MPLFDGKQKTLKESAGTKLIVVGLLIVVLLLPSEMIKKLINERSQTSQYVIDEVASKWGNEQTIGGPFLSLQYSQKDSTNKNSLVYYNIMPEELNIEGNLVPEIRYRGLYKVILYNTDLKITGKFILPSLSALGLSDGAALRNKPLVTIGVPDLRGIREQILIDFNGRRYTAKPGLKNTSVVEDGVYFEPDSLTDSVFTFAFNLKLIGRERLNFLPLGKVTNIKISSSWNNPSFDGAFLPGSRNIGDSGFVATWTVLDLNRDFPQSWLGQNFSVNESAFGVQLMFPVDHYQKAYRSARYAILFIALSFIAFFFIEILAQKRIHPIQYLFIGAALCVFYTLLLSLSEQFDFNLSYLLASLAVIALITSYSAVILKKTGLTVLLGFIMLLLYAFLYTILQLEDYSLLFGSIALFIILALVMFLSRKVNWYTPFRNTDSGEDSDKQAELP